MLLYSWPPAFTIPFISSIYAFEQMDKDILKKIHCISCNYKKVKHKIYKNAQDCINESNFSIISSVLLKLHIFKI